MRSLLAPVSYQDSDDTQVTQRIVTGMCRTSKKASKGFRKKTGLWRVYALLMQGLDKDPVQRPTAQTFVSALHMLLDTLERRCDSNGVVIG